MSNVDDMLLWNSAVQSYDLLKKETTGLAFTNYNLNNGDSINYGYGWAVKKINDVTSIEHGGSIFGFKSMGVYVPSHDIYVIGLSNCDCNSPTQITRDIAAFVMPKH